MPEYKLLYFGIRGRGEAIRLLLADNGLAFDDAKAENWPQLKPTLPFKQLPVFYDGDFVIPQSNAILRHLGRAHNLYGSSPREAARIDFINDAVEDQRLAYARLIYREYDTHKQQFIDALPATFENFEALLAANNGGSGFLVGDKISFADYNMFDLLDIHLVLAPDCLKSFPLLTAYHGRIAARPNVAKHIDSGRKYTAVNGNGKQ
eukprot:Opistho-2@27578